VRRTTLEAFESARLSPGEAGDEGPRIDRGWPASREQNRSRSHDETRGLRDLAMNRHPAPQNLKKESAWITQAGTRRSSRISKSDEMKKSRCIDRVQGREIGCRRWYVDRSRSLTNPSATQHRSAATDAPLSRLSLRQETKLSLAR